jgi:hypothetical protein
LKFASEIIELMAAYPEREFRMGQIVRYAVKGRTLDLKERRAARLAVWRALGAFIENGSIATRPDRPRNGAPAFYRWKSIT